jgi:E3 ubiquitin-protein ligase SHPRH
VHDEIRSVGAEITAKEVRLAQLTTRGRYLDFLGGGQAEKDDDELREDCIICMGSSDDTHGLLLECGHFFCAVSLYIYLSFSLVGSSIEDGKLIVLVLLQGVSVFTKSRVSFLSPR